MKTTCYLTMDSRGAVGLTRRPPNLRRGEVAVQLSITVPDSVFKTTTINVAIDVPAERVIEATAEVEVLEPPTPGSGAQND